MSGILTEMEKQNVVKVGDSVILKKGKNMKVFRVIKKQKVFLEKRHFSLDPIIGHPYGSRWELKNGGLVPVTDETESHDIAGRIEEGGVDNRAIVDDQMAQKLDRDDITDLKEQGKSGQEIIDHLIENSSTFNERTVYSKAKYLKKKKNKHIMRFIVLRPSTRILCEHFFLKAPSKHVQIRLDSLSQMLTASNLQSGSKVMVFEHCQGLLAAAVVERLGGNGLVVQFHTEEKPNHTVLEAYNFPQQFRETLKLFSLRDVHSYLIKTGETRVQNGSSGGRLCAEALTSDLTAPTGSAGKRTEGRTALPIEGGGGELETPTMTRHVPPGVCLSEGALENPTLAGTSCIGAGDPPSQTSEDSPVDPEREDASEPMDVQGQDTEQQSVGLGTIGQRETGGTPADPERSSSVQGKGDSQTSLTGLPETDPDITVPLSPNTLKRKQRDEERVERKRQKLEDLTNTSNVLLQRNMDTLLIATKHHPAPVLLALMDMLALSRPFVVFSPYLEALKECYVKLRDRGGVIHLNLSETWFRDYQILPDRTHPMVNMSSAGGYLLTGIHVAKD